MSEWKVWTHCPGPGAADGGAAEMGCGGAAAGTTCGGGMPWSNANCSCAETWLDSRQNRMVNGRVSWFRKERNRWKSLDAVSLVQEVPGILVNMSVTAMFSMFDVSTMQNEPGK